MISHRGFHFSFESPPDGSASRLGVLRTPHGAIRTPAFMPVGTLGAVRAVAPDELLALGAEIVLANTYHLALRPGIDRIERLGGLHRFMAWNGPILTDSGGYQVMSLAPFRRVRDEGVSFRSHIDGREELFTPERVIEIQNRLGADIIMPLDECLPYPADRAAAREAVNRTLAWTERSIRAHKRQDQILFGIIQGGADIALRRESVSGTLAFDLPGYAVGGVSVGEPKDTLRAVSAAVSPLLPEDRPRYLMGVGLPDDAVAAVGAGFDLFDCVVPTRHGRNGAVFTSSGRLNMRNARFADDPAPLDPHCPCRACSRFSRGAIRHFVTVGEILGIRLCTEHNLFYYLDLFSRMRRAIAERRFEEFKERFLASPEAESERHVEGDEPPRA